MKHIIENEEFDMWVEPSDWRYAAAIVGLSKYLRYFGDENIDYETTDEFLKLRSADINEDRYWQFAEKYYGEELPYKKLENILHNESFSDESIKMVNELLKKNSINKKVFGKVKFDGTNKEEILDEINVHRQDLVKETFRNKSDMYANFANTGQLFEETKPCCRLLGYYVDGGRKSKSIAYNFDAANYNAQDDMIFDFIPFAFNGDREVFFINDNYSVKRLIATNQIYEEMIKSEIERSEGKAKDARKVLFKSIQEVSDFIDFDTEVIVKSRDLAFFETVFIRKESIRILKAIKVYDPFCFAIKINDNYYINVERKVIDSILNLVRTDEVIEILLKQNKDVRRNNSEYIVSQLIKINELIEGDGGAERMRQPMKVAYACAKEVVKRLPDNKRESYRQKLTSAVVFKDYDRCCQILLQLSNYADVPFDFAFDLFENFEENKDIAYTFINALTKKQYNQDDK